MTQGEKLYAASQSNSIMLAIAEQMLEEKEAKKSRKAVSDAKFRESMKAVVVAPKEDVVIPADAAKFNHGRYGVGSLISEDTTTITLAFTDGVKILPKAFTILTKI